MHKYKKWILFLLITIFSGLSTIVVGQKDELDLLLNENEIENSHLRNYVFIPDSCNNLEFRYYDFNISMFDYVILSFVDWSKIYKSKFYKENIVPIDTYKGKKVYNPVSIAQFALLMFDLYNETKDTVLLSQLEKIATKLKGISLEIDSCLFFQYSFDYALHDIESEKLMAPWVSGMAQGHVLSLYSRLYEVTKKDKYLSDSKKIFNSFLKIKGYKPDIWVSCVDKNGNLWLEEYPEEVPALTLNGMLFAIYGVYDYFKISQSQEVKKILQGALTTVKDQINKYETEDISFYCLKHQYKYLKYHEIHIGQLKNLYKMTSDVFFIDKALDLEKSTQSIVK